MQNTTGLLSFLNFEYAEIHAEKKIDFVGHEGCLKHMRCFFKDFQLEVQ